MNYLGITLTSFVNGKGMRTVLWVAGCEHQCKGCHNPHTWDTNSGEPFDYVAKETLFRAMNRTWSDGLTISGGDPLHPENIADVTALAKEFKKTFPDKTLWLYTGYLFEDVKDLEIMQYTDVLVDGQFIEELADSTYKWAGSTNQRVINVRESIRNGRAEHYKG
jgi:anaerobic ribonucleoside-triphosphate reductase activating protein